MALPPLSLALSILRRAQGLTQQDLARAAGTHGPVISEYEAGERRTLSRETFDRLVSLMGCQPDAVQLTLLFVAGFAAAGGGPAAAALPFEPSAAEEQQIRHLAAYTGLLEAGRTRERLRAVARARRISHARDEAAHLWERLQPLPPAGQKEWIERRPRSPLDWALVERLGEESLRCAAERPRRALDLARLAAVVAERMRGAAADAGWLASVRGYAQAFLANALRAGGDLAAAEAAFKAAWRLWRSAEHGAEESPLGTWRLLDLEASLHRDLRRWEPALALLTCALATCPREARAAILLRASSVQERVGHYEAALAAIDEALPLLAANEDPRHRLAAHFNRLVLLCRLDRHEEARQGLPDLVQLVAKAGRSGDAVRVDWLSARIEAGRGRRDSARAALVRVIRHFEQSRNAHGAALASLDLALLFLRAGHHPEVAALAEELKWVFFSKHIESEPLAALRDFVEAALARQATEDLARQTLSRLHAARLELHLSYAL